MKWPLRNGGGAYLRNVLSVYVYIETLLVRLSTLELAACRALLYSTMTFYTVRVLFQYALL